MTYKHHTDIDSPNHSGPRPAKPTSITLHWWGDPDHFTNAPDVKEASGIAKYLSRPHGDSSAHNVCTAGNVWTIVDPDFIAWHAGNWNGNVTSIGIEVDPDLQPGTYETLAELVADYWRVYGKLPLRRHRDWKATACPGPLDVARVNKRANELYNAAPGKKPTLPKPKPKPKPPVGKKPDIRALQGAVRAVKDNIWGEDTQKRLTAVRAASVMHGSKFPYGVKYTQRVVGTPDDGVWGRMSGLAHDITVEKIQAALGIEPSGTWGEKTEEAYQELRAAAIG